MNEYPKQSLAFQKDAIAPIQNKIGAFLADPRLYRILTAPKVDLSLRRVMDEGKVLIIKMINQGVPIKKMKTILIILIQKLTQNDFLMPYLFTISLSGKDMMADITNTITNNHFPSSPPNRADKLCYMI